MEQTPDQVAPTFTFTTADAPLALQLTGKVSLLGAIHRAMKLVGPIAKEGTAPGAIGGFKYRGIEAALNGIHGPLVDAGLLIIPNLSRQPEVTTGGKALRLRVDYVLADVASGETATIVMWADANPGPLAIGGALSYAYKALLFQLFAIPTGAARDTEDDPEPARPVQRRQSAPARRESAPATGQRSSVPAPVETTAGMPSSVAEWKKLAETHNIKAVDVFEAAGVARWSNLIQLSDEAKEALWRTMTTLGRLPTDEGDDHEPQHDPYGYDSPDGAPFEDDTAGPVGQDG